MSPQTRRKIIKNIEARVLPFAVITLMIMASFVSVFYIYQENTIVSGATVDQFSYYKAITLDSGQVPSTQTNCPILINLSSDTDLAADALDTGNDIAFFDDSDNQLNHEIELFNGTTGKLVAWVNVTSLSHSSDTTIYMYYGDSDIGGSAENIEGTWDSDFLFVHHFAGASATDLDDSTSNDHDIAGDGGTPVYNQEKGIGYSIDLDAASEEYVYISDVSALTQGVQTVTAWFNTPDIWNGGLTQIIVSKYDDDAREYKIATLSSGLRTRYYKDASNYISELTDDTHILTNGTWQGVSISHDDNKDVKHYLLGKLRASTLSEAGTYTTLTNGAADVRFGCAFHGGPTVAAEFDGYLSEVRMSSVVRSSDWCVVQYNTMKNSTDGGFFTLGSESSPSDGTYQLGMKNNTKFTWDGTAGTNVWANNSGDYNEHGTIYTNTSGTSEYVDEICLDFTDFDSEVFQENLSLTFINTSDGNWDDITSMVSVPAADGNFSLNSSQWTTGVAGGWADGTNPFNVINYNSSIEFRILCNISSAASAGTYNNAATWYIRWKVSS